jgi:hypothetical protein
MQLETLGPGLFSDPIIKRASADAALRVVGSAPTLAASGHGGADVTYPLRGETGIAQRVAEPLREPGSSQWPCDESQPSHTVVVNPGATIGKLATTGLRTSGGNAGDDGVSVSRVS